MDGGADSHKTIEIVEFGCPLDLLLLPVVQPKAYVLLRAPYQLVRNRRRYNCWVVEGIEVQRPSYPVNVDVEIAVRNGAQVVKVGYYLEVAEVLVDPAGGIFAKVLSDDSPLRRFAQERAVSRFGRSSVNIE